MSKEEANNRINERISTGRKKIALSKIILLAVVGVCIITGVILVIYLGGKTSENYNTVVVPDNVDKVNSDLGQSEYTPSGSYEVVMNYDWNFSDGNSASSNAYVENYAGNTSTVYFTIALSDAPDDDIFTSPDMIVGSHLENIKLDKKLDAGSYDAVLTYHLIDDSRKETSHVSVSITLSIEQ